MGFSIPGACIRRFSVVVALLGGLCLAPAANAFFCLKSGSGNKGFGRAMPYPMILYPATRYSLPPIMPRHPPIPPRQARPYRSSPPLSWRPLNYRPGSL